MSSCERRTHEDTVAITQGRQFEDYEVSAFCALSMPLRALSRVAKSEHSRCLQLIFKIQLSSVGIVSD